MNVPKLRFKEFDGEWEEKKLKEVSTYSNGGSYENDVKSEGNYKLITLKSVDMQGNLCDSGKYLDKEVPTLEHGTLVMILSEQSPGLLGMTAQIPESNKYVLNQRVAAIKPNNNINSTFLSIVINRNQKYFSKKGAGTKVQNISKGNVENYAFYSPNFKEQEKIGGFFEELDKKIQLQQQKIDLLQEQKKGFLQKMFPKAGETQPEIRFDGFTGDWKEYKLGEIVDFYSGLTYSPDDVLEKEGTFVLRSSNIKDGNIVNADNVYVNSLMVNSEKIKQGDIIVVVRNGSRNLIGKHAIVKKEMSNTVIGAFMTGIRAEIPDFINALLDTEKFNIEISKNLGATINQITTGSFKKMIFTIPAEEEQSKIGRFFRAIDDSLEIQQQKLEVLKKQKQGFMQQMFI